MQGLRGVGEEKATIRIYCMKKDLLLKRKKEVVLRYRSKLNIVIIMSTNKH